jgi:AcrR family transcriptional regulator
LGDHVIAIADALFIEKGYGGTSMATVAARARIGKQTLYRRYPDKAALFREVIRRRIDALIAEPEDGAASRDPLAELKSLGAAALETVLDSEFIRLYRIVIAEAGPFPELAIAQAQAAGRCAAGDPEELAKCFLWSLVGEPFHKALSGQATLIGESERRDYLGTVWRIFMNGVSVEG